MTREEQIRIVDALKWNRGKHNPLCCIPACDGSIATGWVEDVGGDWDDAEDVEEDDIITRLMLAMLPPPPIVPGPQPSAVKIWTMLVDNWRATGRTLPVDSAARKEIPIESGANQYWPAALVCLAAWSKFNNNKHNPGEPLHHSRAKSGDHEECIARHGIDIADARLRGDDLTELEEATAVAWRANIRLQILCERLGAPPAPAARFPTTETNK
jgi:hypothetical protein